MGRMERWRQHIYRKMPRSDYRNSRRKSGRSLRRIMCGRRGCRSPFQQGGAPSSARTRSPNDRGCIESKKNKLEEEKKRIGHPLFEGLLKAGPAPARSRPYLWSKSDFNAEKWRLTRANWQEWEDGTGNRPRACPRLSIGCGPGEIGRASRPWIQALTWSLIGLKSGASPGNRAHRRQAGPFQAVGGLATGDGGRFRAAQVVAACAGRCFGAAGLLGAIGGWKQIPIPRSLHDLRGEFRSNNVCRRIDFLADV